MTPDWIEVVHGTHPVLLFAPHGGRRLAPRQPGRHKVNDLHTGALTRALARRWGAPAVINEQRDRNELDLNRISDVRREATWLPALLCELLEPLVTAHGRATVLVVHGWNAVQTVCDVGMGLVERDGRCAPAGDGGRTACDAFIATRVRALQAHARDAGITVTIGARYPAAHRNNLLQLFTAAHRDADDPAVRRLATLACDGRVDAAQLELGIPLRWPGPYRDTFVAALTTVFGTAGPGEHAHAAADDAATVDHPPTAGDTTVAAGAGGRSTGRVADPTMLAPRTRGLQFVAGDLLGFTSIDARGPISVAGRLLVSPAPGRLALFTGELGDRRKPWSVARLRFEDETGGAWRACYDGPLLDFPTLTPFLDLEQGLARGVLVDARVDLRFAPASSEPSPRQFGAIRGAIDLDGVRYDVAADAVSHDDGVHAPRAYPFCRLSLPDLALELVSSDAGDHVPSVPVASDDPSTVAHGRFQFALRATRGDDGLAPPPTATCVLDVASDSATLALRATGNHVAAPLTVDALCERLIPVRRPGRAGAVVHSVYAVVRAPGRAPGWLELAVEHRP